MEIKNCQLYPVFNTCHQVSFQKNLMNRFREKLGSVYLENLNQKKALSIFLHLLNRNLTKK